MDSFFTTPWCGSKAVVKFQVQYSNRQNRLFVCFNAGLSPESKLLSYLTEVILALPAATFWVPQATSGQWFKLGSRMAILLWLCARVFSKSERSRDHGLIFHHSMVRIKSSCKVSSSFFKLSKSHGKVMTFMWWETEL
jgi:hypothetical protein